MDRLESVKMMTTSSAQYLSPDYLQPLPTTLDAKNSPLALLAQTCNSIGKDPPSKAIIPSVEKKDSKTSSPDSRKTTPPSKPRDDRQSVDRMRHSPPKDNTKEIPNFYPLSTSSPKPDKGAYITTQSPKQDTKPSAVTTKQTLLPVPSPKPNLHPSHSERNSPRTTSHESMKDTREISNTKSSPPLKRARSESPPPPTRREYSPGHDSKHLHGMYPSYPHMGLPGLPFGPGTMQPSPEMLAALGYPFSLPGQNGLSMASAQASAIAAHQAALKAGSSSAALAQYMQYARMRNPSLSSSCKDPYCNSCISCSVQPGHLHPQCSSPGCAQCTQEKNMQGLNMFGLPVSSALHSSFSASNLSSASAGLSTLHNLYTQNLLSQQQGHPHVCNWMSGSDYCGKRFGTSEELLQHLRTHTSGGEAALSSGYGLGLPLPSSAELSSLPGYLGSVGGLSPESLRRMYPGTMSPLGSSALGSSALAGRFHPYKSGLPAVPPGLPPPQSLGPYYSPYNIYGQRIGAAAVP